MRRSRKLCTGPGIHTTADGIFSLQWACWVRIFLQPMTTHTQDLTDRFTLLTEKVRRIGEAHGAGRGIAGSVVLLICDMFAHLLRLLASLAEQARTGALADTAPAGSHSASAAGCAAVADRLADDVEPRVCVERWHAGVSGVRAFGDEGADRGGAAGGPQLAPVVADAGGQASERAAAAAAGSCAKSEASIRTEIRARAECGRRLSAARAWTGDSLHFRSRAFVLLSEENGAFRKNGVAGAGRIFVYFVAITKPFSFKRQTDRPTPQAPHATPQSLTRFPRW